MCKCEGESERIVIGDLDAHVPSMLHAVQTHQADLE